MPGRDSTVIPYPDFYDAAQLYLGTERNGVLPSWTEFLQDVLPVLIDAVHDGWDAAAELPGRGDYRQIWRLLDPGPVVYVITVWRDRRTNVLEMRDVVIGQVPSTAEQDDQND